MEFRKVLTVGRKKAEFYEKALSSINMIGEGYAYSETVKFDNGYEMDIKICGADTIEPWTEAVLLDENGDECGCTDVGEEFFGEWWIAYNGNDYYVDVQRGV